MKKTIEGYELESTQGPDGKEVWVATDPAVPGPYAMAEKDIEALAALKDSIGSWLSGKDEPHTESLSSGRATVDSPGGRRIWYAGEGMRA